MSISMYEASVPVFIRQLENLTQILNKAESYAATKKIDTAVFVGSRLIADMYPLAKQIQITADVVRGGAARLAGLEVPAYPEVEPSFADFYGRINMTIDFLKSLTPQQIDGSKERMITLKLGGHEKTFSGHTYLFTFLLPNLYFHSAIAYGILRENGVDLGKLDFLGKF